MTNLNSLSIVIVSAGIGTPSSTQMLASKLASSVANSAAAADLTVQMTLLEIRDLAPDLTNAVVTGMRSPALEEATRTVENADAVIVATPVYKASYSGLFKQFIDVLDDDALLAMPVLLAATAGTPRHALVPDDQMRPLFAFMRAIVAPTSVFAATEDWTSPKLDERIRRAAAELVAIAASGTRKRILSDADAVYRKNFKSSSTDPDDIDFDTDLMRLATGG